MHELVYVRRNGLICPEVWHPDTPLGCKDGREVIARHQLTHGQTLLPIVDLQKLFPPPKPEHA